MDTVVGIGPQVITGRFLTELGVRDPGVWAAAHLNIIIIRPDYLQ
jgi:hypothetical protein